MIPVFAAVEWLSLTDPTVRIVASICTAAFAIIGSCFMAANQRTEKYVTVLQVSCLYKNGLEQNHIHVFSFLFFSFL